MRFGDYSRYYDLLYRGKDYSAEARFVRQLMRDRSPNARTVLDIGCGTGRHAFELADMGCCVTGVDVSEGMIDAATCAVRVRWGAEGCGAPTFFCDDAKSFRLDRKFDVATALFHVMSYQVDDKDFRAVLATVKAHLNPGGSFIFDFWYGPAVLTDMPHVRVLRLEDDITKVYRLAEPEMHPNRNVVDVNYTIIVTDKASERSVEIHETHSMRYWFLPELLRLLDEEGFRVSRVGGWLTDVEPGFDTWGVYIVAGI